MRGRTWQAGKDRQSEHDGGGLKFPPGIVEGRGRGVVDLDRAPFFGFGPAGRTGLPRGCRSLPGPTGEGRNKLEFTYQIDIKQRVDKHYQQ